MSALVSILLNFNQTLARELQIFLLLWRYQHRAPRLTLWWRLMLKRVVDLVLSAAALMTCWPVWCLIALVVKLDSKGPAMYTQERMGRLCEPFKIYKFRTMRVDAEAAGPRWAASDDDPRMTRVGRFLRRTHLDELPQLLNVLKGDMSLVGPRPERPEFVQRLQQDIRGYDERLLIKPGMTGLAQVHYRYDQSLADVKQKVRFDLLYVKRLCLALDLRILAWTVLVVCTGRGVKSSRSRVLC